MSTGSMSKSMVFSDTVRSTSNAGSSARSRLNRGIEEPDRESGQDIDGKPSQFLQRLDATHPVLQPLEPQLYFRVEGVARIRPRKKRPRALEKDGPEVFLKHLDRPADRPLGHRQLIGSLRHRPQPSTASKVRNEVREKLSFMLCIHSVHNSEVKHICFDRPGRGVTLRKDPSALLRDPAGGFTLRPSAKT